MALFRKEEPNMSVNRLDLIETLKKNRTEHKEKYDEMCKGYQVMVAEAVEKFQDLTTSAFKGKDPLEVDHTSLYAEAFAGVIRPTEHLSDFDETIEMLEWIKKEEVRISLGQFKMWVRNEWSWFGRFYREGELPMTKSGDYNRRFGN